MKWSTDQAASYDMFVDRMKACEKHINKNHNLKSRSLAFPERMKESFTANVKTCCARSFHFYYPPTGQLWAYYNGKK